jgi:hypothetical protein
MGAKTTTNWPLLAYMGMNVPFVDVCCGLLTLPSIIDHFMLFVDVTCANWKVPLSHYRIFIASHSGIREAIS